MGGPFFGKDYGNKRRKWSDKMAVSSLLGAAATFLYAVSSLFGGPPPPNNGAMERTLVQNFQSPPAQFFPRVSSFRSGPPFSAMNSNVPSSSASAIPSSSNSSEVYAVT